MKPIRYVLGSLAVITGVAGVHFAARATPPSGISFQVVGRATVPEFNLKRKASDIDWRIAMDADQPLDVVTQTVTFEPGGSSGWHSHPGPVFFTVKTGTLTVYEGDDPACAPLTFTEGTGAVEATTNAHVHMVRNETGSVAVALVTYLIPVGLATRTDLPNPGNCPF